MSSMNSINLQSMRTRQRGQTIIIAMVVLGVLLILGFVFLGLVASNSKSAYNLGNRAAANDLSEAGIRYAHSNLVQSQLGADWRGTPTLLSQASNAPANTTLDPDAFYLRPAAGNGLFFPGTNLIDQGGPDGLGYYFRVQYANGRSLVRVRYAPSDANIFSTSPVGPLRTPGLARDYIIIESIGREGLVNTSDPTTLNAPTPVQFQGFGGADQGLLNDAVALMRKGEAVFPFTQVNRAFASIGILETARFITNKYNVTRPADIGIPFELGVMYNSITQGNPFEYSVQSQLPYPLGGPQNMYTPGTNLVAANNIVMGGSAYSNANVTFHGTVSLNLNQYLGDQFDVAGAIKGDAANLNTGSAGAVVTVNEASINPNTGAWQQTPTGLTEAGGLDSSSPTFNSVTGIFRDGNAAPDQSGFTRGVGAKGVPSMEVVDADTGENRYVLLTAGSGTQTAVGNGGVLGFGSGVYINNPSDVQGAEDETGRATNGTEESLQYDWLNPNNGNPNSAWKGYLYTPPGAVFHGLDDGFTIQLTGATAAEHDWHYIDGTDTNSSFNRFRIGMGSTSRTTSSTRTRRKMPRRQPPRSTSTGRWRRPTLTRAPCSTASCTSPATHE